MKKKKEVHKALLVASKKEVQVHIAPTLEYVRSGAHDVKFRWNAKSLPPKVYESVLSSSSSSKGRENGRRDRMVVVMIVVKVVDGSSR